MTLLALMLLGPATRAQEITWAQSGAGILITANLPAGSIGDSVTVTVHVSDPSGVYPPTSSSVIGVIVGASFLASFALPPWNTASAFHFEVEVDYGTQTASTSFTIYMAGVGITEPSPGALTFLGQVSGWGSADANGEGTMYVSLGRDDSKWWNGQAWTDSPTGFAATIASGRWSYDFNLSQIVLTSGYSGPNALAALSIDAVVEGPDEAFFDDAVVIQVERCSPPSDVQIIQNPAGLKVAVGGSFSLIATASGMAPLDYQWYKDTAPLSGQTGPVLSFMSAQTNDAGNYQVVVTNSCGGATSEVAVVQVQIPCQPIVFDRQPESKEAPPGDDVDLSVKVLGTAPFHYQWWHWGVFPVGEDSPELTVSNLNFGNIGSYYVSVSNCWGLTVWSFPAVVSMTSSTTNYDLPSITFQPQDATAYEGGSAHFDVGVDGDEPLGISWRHNGALIREANEASLVLSDVSSEAAGTYQLFATNAYGATNSRAATLTVIPNARPVVAITNPAPNTAFLVPANLPIQVTASDPDGSVLGVELYANGQLVAALAHPPYDFYYQATNAGARTFTAVATDNHGAQSSCSIPLSFGLPPVQMTFQADASLLLHLVVPPGVRAVGVEASADLNQWTTLTNAPTSGAALDVTDPAAAASTVRFYRVRYSLP